MSNPKTHSAHAAEILKQAEDNCTGVPVVEILHSLISHAQAVDDLLDEAGLIPAEPAPETSGS